MTDSLYDQCIIKDGRGSVIYAARDTGLYRSTDDGRSWASLLHQRASSPVTAVTAHRRDFIAAGVSGGIFTSRDGGGHWHAAALTRPAPFVTALVVSAHFDHDHLLLAGTLQDGVFRSPDGGVSWSPHNYGLWDVQIFALTAVPSGIFYAGTGSGVFISRNDGLSWRDTAFPAGAGAVMRLRVAEDGGILATTEAGDVYHSADFGAHWMQRVTGE